MIKENLAEDRIFNFLLSQLENLDGQAGDLSRSQGNFWYQHFSSHLLSLLGYQPNLKHCSQCGTLIKSGVNYFSGRHFSLICQDCHPSEPQIGLMPVSDNLIKTLRLSVTTEHLNFLKIPEKTLKEWELINKLMIDFI